MSVQDQWAVIGRAKVDGDFAGELLRDFGAAVRAAGYQLEREEMEAARQAIAGDTRSETTGPIPEMAGWQFQQEKMRERLAAQVARMNELGAYTVQILKSTLGNATTTYMTITWMNVAMFVTGLALFIVAAVYGAVAREKIYSLVFAGMGAATFTTIFLVNPISQTQAALSNLVQVEIAFMDYFEQLTFWEGFALAPNPQSHEPDPANIERASALLQQRSRETIELLQVYVEENGKLKARRMKPEKKAEAVGAA